MLNNPESVQCPIPCTRVATLRPHSIASQSLPLTRCRALPFVVHWHLPIRRRLGNSIGARRKQIQSKQLLVTHFLQPRNRYSDTIRNGRWRSTYIFSPSNSTVTGEVNLDVHYYEDGNVRMLTTKPVSLKLTSTSGSEVVRQIAVFEKKYHEDLNRAFTQLNESSFKNLRRQLPVTRQKVEWDKIAGYKVGVICIASSSSI